MSAYVFGVFYTILFVMLCKMFTETFEKKRTTSNRAYKYIVLGCLMIAIYTVSVLLANNFILKEVCVFGCTALFMWAYFKQKIFKIFVLVLLYQGVALTVDYTTIIVVSKCFPVITLEYLSEPMVNIFIGALGQTVLFICIMLIRRLVARKSSEMLTSVEWIKFAIFPIYTIVVIIALLTGFEIPVNDNQKNILICIVFGLIVMNIVVFYLINDILKREIQIRENKILVERIRSETEHFDRQRKREHEYKNQISFIAALARDKKIDKLQEYLKEYSKSVTDNMDLIDTNNEIVNSILNLKYQEAKEKGVAFVVKVNDLSDLRIKDEDIVLILSNLLNNAIEASEKCEDATIKLKFIQEGKRIVISVVNTLVKEPVIEDSKYVSTKTINTEMHGIGIENIKETIEKYGGSCVIKHDKISFRFAILIPE